MMMMMCGLWVLSMLIKGGDVMLIILASHVDMSFLFDLPSCLGMSSTLKFGVPLLLMTQRQGRRQTNHEILSCCIDRRLTDDHAIV